MCIASHALSPSINAIAMSRAATAMSAIAAFWRRAVCCSGVYSRSTGSGLEDVDFAADGFDDFFVVFFLAEDDFAAVFFAAIKALL